MKLVIDIPDHIYKFIIENPQITTSTYAEMIRKTGKPLDDVIDSLNEMDLGDYDFHTIQAIIQILKGEEVTH